MIRNFGGRWEDWEDDLTSERLDAFGKLLRECPPVYVSTAALAGFKPEEHYHGNDAIEQFMAAFPTGNITIH